MTRISLVAKTLLALATVSALGACTRLPDTIKIGVAQPLSGPLAALGQDMLDGTRMAVADLNKEGFKVDGKAITLEVVAVDDKSDAETGKLVAQQLVKDGVVGVIGHLNSGVSMAAAPIYAEKSIPQLAISTKPEYTQMGLATTFRLVASDALQSKAVGSFAAQLPGDHVYAVVDDATPYGKGLADLAAAQLKKRGKNVTLRTSLDDKTTDFKTLVPELKAKNVDVFVTTLADFQVLALIDQLVAAGVHNMNIVGGDTIKTEGMLKADTSVGHIYATSPIVGADEFIGGKAFLTRFRAEKKHDPIYAAHYAYDATYVLAAAIRQAKSIDGKTLVATLKTIDALAPVTSSMRFGEDGEQRYGAVSVYQIDRGGWFLLTRSDAW
jgi:branched-chain amino acid transport system substrate-binding protein